MDGVGGAGSSYSCSEDDLLAYENHYCFLRRSSCLVEKCRGNISLCISLFVGKGGGESYVHLLRRIGFIGRFTLSKKWAILLITNNTTWRTMLTNRAALFSLHSGCMEEMTDRSSPFHFRSTIYIISNMPLTPQGWSLLSVVIGICMRLVGWLYIYAGLEVGMEHNQKWLFY